jgi:hypothetical protein
MAQLCARQSMFISMLLGGRIVYTGKDIHEAHVRAREQGLNDGHFDRSLAHFREALYRGRCPCGQGGEGRETSGKQTKFRTQSVRSILRQSKGSVVAGRDVRGYRTASRALAARVVASSLS